VAAGLPKTLLLKSTRRVVCRFINPAVKEENATQEIFSALFAALLFTGVVANAAMTRYT